MSTPGDWATRADRDAAVRLVESAWADGQIVEEERDRRVTDLARAETKQDVERVVRDLRVPSYQLVSEARPPLRTLDQRTIHPGRPGRVATGAIVAAGVALLAVAVVGLTLGNGVTEAEADGPVPVLTGKGYDDLVTAVRDETGGTEAFSAVLYPEYAVLDLPVDADSQRRESWYWDGDLDATGKGSTGDERFDLAEVDLALVLRLLTDVQGRVEDETTWYVIVHAPAEHDGSVYQVYASNDYQETAYVTATADGTITYRSEPSS